MWSQTPLPSSGCRYHVRTSKTSPVSLRLISGPRLVCASTRWTITLPELSHFAVTHKMSSFVPEVQTVNDMAGSRVLYQNIDHKFGLSITLVNSSEQCVTALPLLTSRLSNSPRYNNNLLFSILVIQ